MIQDRPTDLYHARLRLRTTWTWRRLEVELRMEDDGTQSGRRCQYHLGRDKDGAVEGGHGGARSGQWHEGRMLLHCIFGVCLGLVFPTQIDQARVVCSFAACLRNIPVVSCSRQIKTHENGWIGYKLLTGITTKISQVFYAQVVHTSDSRQLCSVRI
jgi:hypothetical protein